MRRIVALLLVVTLSAVLVAQPAQAGGSTANVALGLASFAVFTSLAAPFFWYPRPAYAWYGPPAYYAPPAYPAPVYYPPPAYAPPTVVVRSAPPAPSVVQYPHGRYELRGDGVSTPYRWVWIPKPPAAPPPPAPRS